MKNILLTGRPGCGKTTLVKNIIAKLPGLNKQGFFTEEIRKGSARVGFKIVTLSGEEAVLSHVQLNSQYSVGKYKVNVDALEDVAADTLIKAKAKADLIVIDEIGRMELFSELMRLSVVEALDSPKKVLAVISDAEEQFVEMIKGRKDVEIIEVTVKNRDKLVDEIAGRFSASSA